MPALIGRGGFKVRVAEPATSGCTAIPLGLSNRFGFDTELTAPVTLTLITRPISLAPTVSVFTWIALPQLFCSVKLPAGTVAPGELTSWTRVIDITPQTLGVGVGVAVLVRVRVAVLEAVRVGVRVGVRVAVGVLVFVRVGV